MMILIMAIAAATVVSFASAFRGNATYYTSDNYVPSSCYGFRNSGDQIAAVGDALWKNRTACGKIYTLSCSVFTAQGELQLGCRNGSVVVEIVDRCVPCEGTSIDISEEAFALIADPSAGRIEIEYNEMAVVPSPNFVAESPTHSHDSRQDFLNVHNAARSEVGVPLMTWDDAVASYAKNYAKQRIGDCNLVPSRGPYGENLANNSGNFSEADAVRTWINEKTNYDNKSNICAPGHVCSHYAQVIWANSTRLGCAKVGCDNGGTFVVCNYEPPRPHSAPKKRKDVKGLLVGLTVGAGVLIFGICFVWFISRRKKQETNKLDDPIYDVSFGSEFHNGTAPRKFSLAEIAKATSNFKCEKLGEGGFGAVYRGYVRDLDTHVAVKRISKASRQGIKEYASEVKIISRLRHKNLVKLIGWCHEKRELILVYEFMANGSLDSHLFKGKSLLTWDVRFKIVQGLASALFYLHEEGDHCVLHRDIKTSNIMLDSSFNAKLGDFGLARLVDHAKGSQTTHLAGTIGYMAPECVSSGKASKESDVYSFGIVALEIACGRRSIEPRYDESQASLVAWVWDSYGNGRLLDAADQKLCLNFDAKQMECLLMVGLWCVHPDQNLRPPIRLAIQVLNFEAPLPMLPSTRPTPTYAIPIASGPGIKASEPCFSTLTITVPR